MGSRGAVTTSPRGNRCFVSPAPPGSTPEGLTPLPPSPEALGHPGRLESPSRFGSAVYSLRVLILALLYCIDYNLWEREELLPQKRRQGRESNTKGQVTLSFEVRVSRSQSGVPCGGRAWPQVPPLSPSEGLGSNERDAHACLLGLEISQRGIGRETEIEGDAGGGHLAWAGAHFNFHSTVRGGCRQPISQMRTGRH